MSRRNEPRVEDRFPTVHARRKADEAIDAVGPHEPVWKLTDTWYEAYIAAGGVVRGGLS